MRALLVLAGSLVAVLAAALLFRLLSGSWSSRTAKGPPFPWRVEARLELLSERNPDLETSRLTVVLRDAKGKEVETPDLHLELDGVPLSYAVGRGNYYDRHPAYRLGDDDFRFAPDATYELGARRGEEPAVPLARLTTPKAFGPANLRLPGVHPGERDLEIGWTGLSQPADLLVTRTTTYLDGSGNEVTLEGGAYGDDVIRRRIGSRGLRLPDGSTTIPAAWFALEEGRVTSVRVVVSTTLEGRFLCRVEEPSTLTAVREVELPIEVTTSRPR